MHAANPPAPEDNAAFWVTLAIFTQPHGVSGRMKVKSFTDPADDFSRHANLSDEAGNRVKLTITGHTQGLAIVAIEGISRREQAELLRGRKIGVWRHELPPLPRPNLYYTDDLIGMAVVDADGTPFGSVCRIANYGAGDILEIARTGGAQEMYAFNHATFPAVDSTTRRITIHPPEIFAGENTPQT